MGPGGGKSCAAEQVEEGSFLMERNFQLIQSSGDMAVVLGVFCEVRNHNHDYEGI